MGQHAQAIREKHTARNVTLIVLAVLIVLLAIAAVFGMQLYKQAKSVKAHESQAISSLSAINDPAKLKDAAASQAYIAQAQQQTAQAKQIAHGSLWNVAAKMPFVGSDIATVQGMTEVVDNLAQQTLPSLTTAVQQLAVPIFPVRKGNLICSQSPMRKATSTSSTSRCSSRTSSITVLPS